MKEKSVEKKNPGGAPSLGEGPSGCNRQQTRKNFVGGGGGGGMQQFAMLTGRENTAKVSDREKKEYHTQKGKERKRKNRHDLLD